MEQHWYGNPEVSGSSPGSVKFSLPILQMIGIFDSPLRFKGGMNLKELSCSSCSGDVNIQRQEGPTKQHPFLFCVKSHDI